MTRQNITTTEAAYLAGVDPRSFSRWARDRGLAPERKQRIGRSTVTLWSVSSLMRASLLANEGAAC